MPPLQFYSEIEKSLAPTLPQVHHCHDHDSHVVLLQPPHEQPCFTRLALVYQVASSPFSEVPPSPFLLPFQISLTRAGSLEAASLLPSSIIRLAAPLRTCTVTLVSLSLLASRHYIHVRSSPCHLICEVRNDRVLMRKLFVVQPTLSAVKGPVIASVIKAWLTPAHFTPSR